MIKDIKRL